MENVQLFSTTADPFPVAEQLEDGTVILSFGKFSETPIQDVPANYLRWMVHQDGQNFLPIELRYLAEKILDEDKTPRPRCVAITQDGGRCSRPVQGGTDYCWQHKKRTDNEDDGSELPDIRDVSAVIGWAEGAEPERVGQLADELENVVKALRTIVEKRAQELTTALMDRSFQDDNRGEAD